MKNSILFSLLLSATALFAQESSGLGSGNSSESKAAQSTEFSIPSSAAFNMLNENTPSRIERYAALHDIKVDWSLTNGQQGYTLSPGIAIEVQPVWMLFFDRAGAAKYRTATPLARTLSTLSVSVGTNASNEKNWLAWGAKLNLYRQHDPLKDAKFLRTLDETTEDSKDTLLLKIKKLEMEQIRLSRRDSAYEERHRALGDSIIQVEFDIQELEREQSRKLAEAREQYIQKHWNSSFVDISFGRLLTYASVTDTIFQVVERAELPGTIDTVALGNNTLQLAKQGYGVWLSAGVGIGQNAMISGMIRYGKKPSRITGTIGQTYSAGLNLRFGNRRHNFFIEGFYDVFIDPLLQAPEVNVEQKFYMLTIGGDWRISRNVMLSFGIRQTKDFDNSTYLLQPLVNVNCLMR